MDSRVVCAVLRFSSCITAPCNYIKTHSRSHDAQHLQTTAEQSWRQSFDNTAGVACNSLAHFCDLLQDSWNRMQLDMERSRREGFKFGAKLVRGAYMYLERERARDLKFDSPIWNSLEETHANYNRYV